MSTYPPNLRRAPNDLLDIAFLAKLLDEDGSKIPFQLYHPQYPEILDQAVKDAVTFLQSKGLVAQSALLINIIAPSDRERLGIYRIRLHTICLTILVPVQEVVCLVSNKLTWAKQKKNPASSKIGIS